MAAGASGGGDSTTAAAAAVGSWAADLPAGSNDAAMALSGGVGTLAEIATMWNLMIVESLPPRPLILVGSGWQSTFDQFFKEFESYTHIQQRELIYFAKDVKTAVEMLKG